MTYQLLMSTIYYILRRKLKKSGVNPILQMQKLKFQDDKQVKSAQNEGSRARPRF